jgi:RNA polymerase sigma-70 factor, ECF subfamily
VTEDPPRAPVADEGAVPAADADRPAADAAPASTGSAPLRPTAAPDDAVARRDAILVERARSGDLTAFNDIVELHQDFLHGLVARVVPDIDQADDVTQEAFFRAYRQLGAYRGGSLRSWLARIAMNAALDLQRARRRRPVQPYPELEDETWQPPSGSDTDPEVVVTTAERHAAIVEALARITADQRAAIVLFDVEGFDYGEIAEMTGVSLGTVKSRIHRGRLAMRGLLADRLELFRER